MQSVNETIRTATKIQALNDDILREVFKNLNDQDLSAVADVCINFKQTAHAVIFLQKRLLKLYKIIIESSDSNTEKNKFTEEIHDLRRLPSFVRNFGQSISFLHIETRGPYYPKKLDTRKWYTS